MAFVFIEMTELSKILIGIGVAFVVLGVLTYFIGKVPGLGKLPGDLLVKKDNFTFYFPITTCIVASMLFSLLLFLWNQK